MEALQLFPQCPYPYSGMEPRHAYMFGMPAALFINCMWNIAFIASMEGEMDDDFFFKINKNIVSEKTSLNLEQQESIVHLLAVLEIVTVKENTDTHITLRFDIDKLDSIC